MRAMNIVEINCFSEISIGDSDFYICETHSAPGWAMYAVKLRGCIAATKCREGLEVVATTSGYRSATG